ncbi:hypothetical protein [Agrobacterium rosae]
MFYSTETFVLIGSIVLASWMAAGFISVIGYSHLFRSRVHVFDLAAITLCGLGAILATAMLVALAIFG